MIVSENTRNITLHSKNLNISTDEIVLKTVPSNAKAGEKVSVDRTEFVTEHDFFVIHTKEELVKDGVYEVSIPFRGNLNSGLLGYYRSSYSDKKSNEKRYDTIVNFESRILTISIDAELQMAGSDSVRGHLRAPRFPLLR